MSNFDDFNWDTADPNGYNQVSKQSNVREAEGIPLSHTNGTHTDKERKKEEEYKQVLNGKQLVPNQNEPKKRTQQRQQQASENRQAQGNRGQQTRQTQQARQMQQTRQGQSRNPQQRPQQTRPPMSNQVQQPQKPQKKKGGFGKIVLVAVIVVVGVVAFKKFGGETKAPVQELVFETTGKYAYDNLLTAIQSQDATKIDSSVGTKDGDSYIAQEWAYINGVALRQEFLSKVSSIVKFTYPESSTTDANGNKTTETSYMNNGESVTITIPDYAAMSSEMDADKDYIISLMKSAGYKNTDYDWSEEMANLMFQWILDRSKFPTTTIDMALPIGNNGQAYVKDDSALDDALYGSDEFRAMSDKFSQIATEFTGYKTEDYKEKEEQHNDEYDDWFKLFIKYYKQDGGKYNKKTGKFSGGHFHKGSSKWEPWYLRDDNNNFILDEDGNKVVNYYSIKRKDGTDWIQPDETVMVEVTKQRQVEDPWVPESGIRYNILGTHYIQTVYDGKGDKIFRVGDGTKENPAGIGTSIITKAPCTDGKFHDVKVTLIGYWTKQNAIDYVESFDTRNRGFSTTSAVSLIAFEMRVENLEQEPITVIADMALSDGNSNVSSRTGTVYGFESEKEIQPGENEVLNDWATSTELEQKYVVWGKSFGRNYAMVYFDCLAGTGKIPSYSAYKAFTGASSLNSQFVAEEVEQQQAMQENSTTSSTENSTQQSTQATQQE